MLINIYFRLTHTVDVLQYSTCRIIVAQQSITEYKLIIDYNKQIQLGKKTEKDSNKLKIKNI